jgi:hypothetical protein
MQYNVTAVSQALYSCVEFLQYRASKTRDIASQLVTVQFDITGMNSLI